MIAPKLFEQGMPNRTAPIVLEMIEPIRGLDERRTLTGRRIGNANTVSSRAKMNFLFHLVSTKAGPFRLHQASSGFRNGRVLCLSQESSAKFFRRENQRLTNFGDFIKFVGVALETHRQLLSEVHSINSPPIRLMMKFHFNGLDGDDQLLLGLLRLNLAQHR